MAQTEQEKLIGEHPKNNHIFGQWWSYVDLPTTDRKKHRKLEENPAFRSAAIDKLAEWIVESHATDLQLRMIDKQRAILDKHGLSRFVDILHVLPRTDTTQKGNLGEIVLIEYLKESRHFTPLVHKLHYNPNPDQSMKGDDVLLFKKDNLTDEVIYGECKFRGTPKAEIVDEIVGNLEGLKKLPISMGFVANRIDETGNHDLAEQLMDLQVKIYNGEVPVTNVGFLISKSSKRAGCGTSAIVEENLVNSEISKLAVKMYLQTFVDNGIENLILGCTHYPVLSDAITKVFKGVTLINAGTAIADAVAEYLKQNGMENKDGGNSSFYVSDKPDFFKTQAAILLDEDIDDGKVQKVDISKI